MSKVPTPNKTLQQTGERAPRNKGGRPKGTSYTQEVGERIAELVLQGWSLARIAEEPGMPSVPTITRWKDSVPEFASIYAHARLTQADQFVDRIVETGFDANCSPSDRRVKLHALETAAKLIAPRRYGTQYTDNTTTVRQAEVDREAIILAAEVLQNDIIDADWRTLAPIEE